jgi:predicted nucleic acid-binding protein
MVVMLDTGPLGIVTNPANTPETVGIREWLMVVLEAGHEVIIPEIADYELRRELVRAALTKTINRLNELERTLSYLPLTTQTMRRAAEVWADARNWGKPLADEKALDGDAILIAQAQLHPASSSVVIATENVGHLSLFAKADVWRNIRP